MHHLLLTGIITNEGFNDAPFCEWGGCPTDAEGPESEEELNEESPK
jgi:hypothetical protein